MDPRKIAACLAAVLLVAACAPAAVSEQAPAASPTATPVSATFAPSATPPIDTSLAARPAGVPVTVLVDVGPGQPLWARPVDPATLRDVPGYQPILFEHHYVARVSPDGSTIAAILWPSGSANSGATVHLIDTHAWTDRQPAVKVDSYTSALYFDDAGTSLYWIQPTADESIQALMRLDLGTGTAREVMKFASGYSAGDLRVVGSRVAVWLVPTSGVMIDGKPRDAPELAIVDPVAGLVSATVRLPDIRAGYLQDASSAEGSRDIEPGLAWDLPRSQLYIADAESDRVYTIDLRAGAMRVVTPRPRRSMVDMLWSLFGSAAQAKMMDATRQQAAISPDGTRLYVTGERDEFVKGQDGVFHEVVTPIELRVIDTSDMSELARRDAATTALWVSPDGTRLLYGTNSYDDRVEGYATPSDFRVHLLDTATSGESALLLFGGPPSLLAFDPKTGVGYLEQGIYGTFTASHAAVIAIDLGSGRILARRELDRYFADLLVLRPRD